MPEDEQPTERDTAPDNVAPEPTQPQLAPGQMALSLTPQGLQLAIMPTPFHIRIDEAGVNQMVEEWLNSHPELWDVIVKKRIEALRAQKNHLALVQHIKKTRND